MGVYGPATEAVVYGPATLADWQADQVVKQTRFEASRIAWNAAHPRVDK